jgi:hypothetical protein
MGYTSPMQFWCVVASNAVSNIKLSHFLDLSLAARNWLTAFRSVQANPWTFIPLRFKS